MEKEYLKTFMVMISFHKNWIIIERGKTFSLAFPQVRTGHFESFFIVVDNPWLLGFFGHSF